MPEGPCLAMGSGWFALEPLDDSWLLVDWISCMSEAPKLLDGTGLAGKGPFLSGWLFIMPIISPSR